MHFSIARFISVSICISSIAFLAWASTAILPKPFAIREQPFGGYYSKLARHFLMGRIDVGPPPPTKLLEAQNPYDFRVHTTITSEAKIDIWDHSFYKGKLYLYFGVAPALLIYTPYLALTGTDLKDGVALVFLLTLTLVGFCTILARLKNLSVIDVPWWVYGVSLVLLATSSIWPILLARARTYEIPLASALAFSVWGIWFLLSSYRNKDWNTSRLVCASSCFSLAVASRPHYIFSAVAVTLYLVIVLRKKWYHSLKTLCALIFPLGIVLAGLGIYNYARFDDVFEFGAHYQLGTTDLREVPFFKLSRFFSGIYIVLFHPLLHTKMFPFFAPVRPIPEWAGQGRIFIEHPFGYFYIAPLSLLGMVLGCCFAVLFLSKILRNKEVHSHTPTHVLVVYGTFALIGLSNLFMCTIWVAVIDRYTTEFALFFSAFSILLLLRIATVNSKRTRNVIFGVLTFFAVYGCITSHILTKQWIFERSSRELFNKESYTQEKRE